MATRLQNLALSESGFLFDPSTGHSYSLNPTGAFLLRELIRGTSVEALPAAVAAAFETDEERAGRDVERFLQQLEEMGLRAPARPGDEEAP